MTLKEEVRTALEALTPKTNETKAKLENDPAARAVSSFLKKTAGLGLIEYIIGDLKSGKEPLIVLSKWTEKQQLLDVMEFLYHENDSDTLEPFLLAYHEIWIAPEAEDVGRNAFEVISSLATSPAAGNVKQLFTICVDCKTRTDSERGDCPDCKGRDVVEVSELSLHKNATAVLDNRQFLELYLKECMAESGIEVVTWRDDRNMEVATSIGYQVEGETVEPDVTGITEPVGIMVCEAKTSKKMKLNDIRRIGEPFQRLVEKVRKNTGKDVNSRFLLVITGFFDENIKLGSMMKKGWELLDRKSIAGLTNELARIQSEL
ncbi:MAG: hypothetical protein KAW09_05860 [Thermoplasmata archaeon]|nr:hypothetical protein [Thermoplasmata archaeon]